MTTVSFRAKMGGAWFDINFAYDEALKDLLKGLIPYLYRTWDNPTKTWSANASYARLFAEQARAAGHSVVGMPGLSGGPTGQASSSRHPPPKMPPPPPPVPVPVISWADVLLARCNTPESREKLYKHLAKLLHTDISGEYGTLMQELNDARNSYGQNRSGTA